MPVAILTIHLHIPECTSLKQKRSRIKPVVVRLHKQFNISVAEMDFLDHWKHALIGCAMIANDSSYLQTACQSIVEFIPHAWPDIQIIDHQLELL